MHHRFQARAPCVKFGPLALTPVLNPGPVQTSFSPYVPRSCLVDQLCQVSGSMSSRVLSRLMIALCKASASIFSPSCRSHAADVGEGDGAPGPGQLRTFDPVAITFLAAAYNWRLARSSKGQHRPDVGAPRRACWAASGWVTALLPEHPIANCGKH